MMKYLLYGFTLITLLISSATLQSNEEVIVDRLPTKSDSKKAMSLFQDKQYLESRALYDRLAKTGDKHAQYMLSVFAFNGLSEQNDPQKAYAWAKLSQTTGAKTLVENFSYIKSQLSSAEIDEAEKLYSELQANFNDLAIAKRYQELFSNKVLHCTGSRIKGNCGNIKVNCGGIRTEEGLYIPLSFEQEKRCKEYEFNMNIAKILKNKENAIAIKQYITEQYSTNVLVEEVESGKANDFRK
ncbi:hypothetical protein [Kangiella sp. HZ709]|uniref:hypothetical protein n=1 Tax=Kangiella sp. HZ709 TaxID=2666328 RepID=UPI0012AFF14A|nr:hypothetical protein [Kangiella sp. HZ709]MRX28419.1 hypothetical protein [Kangiella sp. HZ709]